jgi:hypothetical protein
VVQGASGWYPIMICIGQVNLMLGEVLATAGSPAEPTYISNLVALTIVVGITLSLKVWSKERRVGIR